MICETHRCGHSAASIHLLAAFRVLFVLAVVAAGSSGCRDGRSEDRLTLTGSSTVAPLALEMGRRFEQQHPGTRVDVQTGGSSRGIHDARRGLADIGMVSRALRPGEDDLTSHTIARDGICLIVHADNKVGSLDDDSVRRIFRGEVSDWREVGGEAGPITVVNKAEGRSTLELFLHHYELDNTAVDADVVIGDNEQGVRTVAGNPGAVGYVSVGTAEYNANDDVPIRLLSVGGVDATTANVREGSFPLARPLNLVTTGEPSPTASRFIEFAQSSEVHDLVEQLYFVPAGP